MACSVGPGLSPPPQLLGRDDEIVALPLRVLLEGAPHVLGVVRMRTEGRRRRLRLRLARDVGHARHRSTSSWSGRARGRAGAAVQPIGPERPKERRSCYA